MISPGEYIHYCFLFVREKALSSAFFNPYSFNGLFQVPAEKFSQFVERDDVDPVVQIDVSCAPDVIQFLRFGSTLAGIFRKFFRVCLIASDEEQGTWRDRFHIVERIEVHELDVGRQGRVRRQFF